MRPDTIVQIGDFKFKDFDVPSNIPFGGEQKIVVQELVGGARVVDSLGRSDRPMEFGGLFLGEDASIRARYLDSLRIAGKTVVFAWAEFSYRVKIASFMADYTNFHEIPYRMSLVVVEDLTNSAFPGGAAGLDDMMDADMKTATVQAGLIPDATLKSLVATLQTAVDNVQSFVNATKAEIASVTAPLIATQEQVRTLIATVDPIIDDAVSIGNVVPGLGIGIAATNLEQQITSFVEADNLYELQSTLGRMSTNLSADGVAGRIVTTAGGDLYHIAAAVYGDASAWPTIARANALTDPVIVGVKTLTVPGNAGTPDGVLTS